MDRCGAIAVGLLSTAQTPREPAHPLIEKQPNFMNSDIVTSCVLIIGNEILSGRTQDTNLSHIANTLGAWGIRVTEAQVIPDVEEVIIDRVNTARANFDYVFTTGGIGPTHDDITAHCMARAFARVGFSIRPAPSGTRAINRRDLITSFGASCVAWWLRITASISG